MKFKIADFSSRAQKSPKTAQKRVASSRFAQFFEEVLCKLTN